MRESSLVTFQDDILLRNNINYASLHESVQKAIQFKMRGYRMMLEENGQLEEKNSPGSHFRQPASCCRRRACS
jgi:hypothetical protein